MWAMEQCCNHLLLWYMMRSLKRRLNLIYILNGHETIKIPVSFSLLFIVTPIVCCEEEKVVSTLSLVHMCAECGGSSQKHGCDCNLRAMGSSGWKGINKRELWTYVYFVSRIRRRSSNGCWCLTPSADNHLSLYPSLSLRQKTDFTTGAFGCWQFKSLSRSVSCRSLDSWLLLL